MNPGFSSTKLSLIDRNIIWATAHIRGGMEKGMKWWKEGKLTNKKIHLKTTFMLPNIYLKINILQKEI